MLQYPRIPSNAYSYRPTIFGFPIKAVLSVAVIICAGILVSEFSIYLSLVLFTFVPTVIIGKRYAEKSNFLLKINNFLSRKERIVRLNDTTSQFNSFVFLTIGDTVTSYFEVTCQDVIVMRENIQHLIFNEVQAALDICEADIDFFSVPSAVTGTGQDLLKYRTYLRFGKTIKGEVREKIMFSLTQEMENFTGRLKSSGFVVRKISESAELLSLKSNLLDGSEITASTGHTSKTGETHKIVKYRKHRKYIETSGFSADLLLVDSDYNSGPYYQTFVESTGIPAIIHTSVRRAGGKNPGKFLKSMISERKAELKVAGTNTPENNFLKQQLQDLERMRDQYERVRARPLNVVNTIRVFSDHPAELSEQVSRVRTGLEQIGMKTVELTSSMTSLTRFVDNSFHRKQVYLMSSIDVAHIVPLYREPHNDNSGILLGIDDLSERISFYNPFRQNSHNSLVIGETGSGKSFFSKLMVIRAMKAGVIRSALIFDPLNEYFCDYFDAKCSESYIDDFIDSSRGSRESFRDKVTIIKISPEDMDDDNMLHMMLSAMNSVMMNDKSSMAKMIVVDECHIILRNNVNNKLLSSMVRHSRHYGTSIVNVSQNTDDFLNERSGSIAFNSNRIFIFRTRNLRETHKKVLKLEGFSHEPAERLMGGSLHPYSECIVSDGDFCRKLRIISSSDEDKLLQSH